MQTQEPRLFSTGRDPRGSQIGTTVALLTFGVMLAVGLSVYIAVARFHFTPDQVLEIAVFGPGGHGCYFPTITVTSLKMGRYIAITMPPTTPPISTIIMGSIMEVIASTELSTSSS